MYCEACGTQLGEAHRFCPRCGKPQSIAMVQPNYRNRVQQHIHMLSVLWIAYGILALLGATAIFGIRHLFLDQFIHIQTGPIFVGPLVRGIMGTIGFVILCKGVLGVTAGWSLLQRESWARAVAIVVSFLAILNIPFGTALGVYSLWVLLPEHSGRDYEELAQAA